MRGAYKVTVQCIMSSLWMAHPVPVCGFLFLAHPLLWGTSWRYPQRLYLILLLFTGGLPFYNFTWVPSDPFNSICLQSEPLVPSKTTLHCAFPTINTVTQTRTLGMVDPSPSVHSCHLIYYCFLLPPHHSMTSPSLLLGWSFFLPFLAWIILTHTWSFCW